MRAPPCELSIAPLPCERCSWGLSRAEGQHLLQPLSILLSELPGMPGGDRDSCRTVPEVASALPRRARCKHGLHRPPGVHERHVAGD